MDQVARNRFVLRDHRREQCVYSEIGIVGDEFEDPRLHAVNSRQNLEFEVWFLLNFHDVIAGVNLNIAEAERRRDDLSPNREQRVLRVGEIAEGAEVQFGQDVTVHEQERLGEIGFEQRKRAAGAERLGLAAENELHPVLRAVSEKSLHEIRHVIGRDVDFIESVVAQGRYLYLHEGFFPKRKQGFRDDFGEWPQSCSEAACKYYSFHLLTG